MRAFVALLLVAPTLITSLVWPRSSGILPGEFLVPPNPSSALPSCGTCHDPAPNTNGVVQVSIVTGARVLDAGAATTATLTVAGGPGLGLAGFCLESDGGLLAPGTNTRTTPAGNAITHLNKFSNSFAFGFQAATSSGLVRWTAVGQSVNVNNNTAGDSFGFYGPDSATPGVPYRMFVNGPGVLALGRGCTGTDGHEPLLGATTPMTIAQSFMAELHNAPPGATALCSLGSSTTSWGGIALPFDLAAIGAPGCLVLIDHIASQMAAVLGTGSGGGSMVFPWPVPNDPGLRGLVVYLQGYVIDAGAAGSLTVTNALQATVQ